MIETTYLKMTPLHLSATTSKGLSQPGVQARLPPKDDFPARLARVGGTVTPQGWRADGARCPQPARGQKVIQQLHASAPSNPRAPGPRARGPPPLRPPGPQPSALRPPRARPSVSPASARLDPSAWQPPSPASVPQRPGARPSSARQAPASAPWPAARSPAAEAPALRQRPARGTHRRFGAV